MELRHEDAPVVLNATPMRLLQFLLEEHHRVVPKEEVLERVWPDANVSDASLATALREIRQALGDDGAQQRWIRTARGRGYRFVGEVSIEVGASSTPGAAPTTAVQAPSGEQLFVGREGQLHSLELRWQALPGSGAQLALLTGPAGIGKTRLALEFEARVQARGDRSLFAWCYEGKGAPPYWPWSRLVRAFLRGTSSPSGEGALGEDREILTPLLGEHGGTEKQAVGGTWSPEDEFRFIYAVAGFFRRAAGGRRLLITIDDLQWSDRSSLRLLSFLARELDDAPILFIATVRDDEPGGTPLSEVIRALRHPRGAELPLAPLAEEERVRLVQGMLGEHLREPTLRILTERSGGNPLFLTGLVSMIQSDSRLRDAAAVQALIPQAVQDLILERIRQLSPHCRKLIEFAAVVGRELPSLLLAHAGLADVNAALAEALSAGILVAQRDQRRSFRLRDSLVAEVIRDTLPLEDVLALHRDVTEAIERMQGDDLDPVAAELAAHHAILAREGGPPEPAVRYATRAGHVALVALAYEEAADHFQVALACARLEPNQDAERECDLLVCAGDALKRAGRGLESRKLFERAIDLARLCQLPTYFAEAVLGLAPGFFGAAGSEDPSGRMESPIYDSELVTLLSEALEMLPKDSNRLRSLLLSRSAVARIGGAPEEERDRLSQEALETARRVGDRATLSYALSAHHSTLGRAQDFERRRALVEGIPERSVASGSLELAMIERIYRLSLTLELGDMRSADREIESCLEHARALRLPRSLRHAQSFRAMYLCITGEFSVAIDQLTRLVAAAEEEDDASNALLLRLRLAHAQHEVSTPPNIELALLAAVRMYPQMLYFRAGLAKTYLDREEFERARAELDAILKAGVAAIPRSEGWGVTVALIAEVAAALSERRLCAELYELLAPASGRFIVVIFSTAVWASADRVLAALAYALGDRESGRRHYEQALALERRAGARPLEARTLYTFALAEANHDRERARGLINDARAIALQLGMQPLLSQIDRAQQSRAQLR